MLRVFAKKSWFFLVFSLLCCSDNGGDARAAGEFKSFRDAPGATAEEIAAVEEIARTHDSLVFGALASAEAFSGADGGVNGYAAILCGWLSDFFGVRFVPKIYEWGDIYPELAADFTSELTATDERRTQMGFMFTPAIAERSTKYFRIARSRPLSEIANERPLRLAFLEGSTTSKAAIAKLNEMQTEHKDFYIKDYKSAYDMIKSGKADAFIDEMIVSAAFDDKSDVVMENFFPLIYEPVSLAAQKPELKPMIDIMRKAINGGAFNHLMDLYERGIMEYARHNLFLALDEREREYLRNNKNVAYLAEHDNYPLSFWNANEGEWQGIAFDALKEIAMLTGLEFKPVNEPGTSFSDLMAMLESGKGAMISELLKSPERKGRFLWPERETLRDNYVAISKADMPNIVLVNRIMQLKVGVQAGTAYADLFNSWFPNHPNVASYENADAAFNGLENGEIDILMFSSRHLLDITHYQEKPDFKVNMVFDYTFGSQFGFNKDEEALRSIVDKAMGVIDVDVISEQWLRKTFDYRAKIAAAQRPWLAGVIGLLVVIIALVSFLNFRIREKTSNILDLQNALLKTMAEMVEGRDDITGGHIERTQRGVKILLDEIERSGLFQAETKEWNKSLILRSCQLHDVGKVFIADSILKKPGKLTNEEFREMQKHTTYGGQIIGKVESLAHESDFLKYAKTFAVSHHEKWDGNGYPDGLKGNDIPLLGRVMAIADVYDALTSERPYKKAFSHEDAARIINEGSGTQFDPALVEVFNRVAGKFAGKAQG